MSRSEKLLERNHALELTLPPVQLEYLVHLFYEVGLCEQGFNGAVRLSWSEVTAWLLATGRKLNHWEVTTLIDMSNEYVRERNSTEGFRPIPYGDVKVDKVKEAKQLEDFFEMMINKKEALEETEEE